MGRCFESLVSTQSASFRSNIIKFLPNGFLGKFYQDQNINIYKLPLNDVVTFYFTSFVLENNSKSCNFEFGSNVTENLCFVVFGGYKKGSTQFEMLTRGRRIPTDGNG